MIASIFGGRSNRRKTGEQRAFGKVAADAEELIIPLGTALAHLERDVTLRERLFLRH